MLVQESLNLALPATNIKLETRVRIELAGNDHAFDANCAEVLRTYGFPYNLDKKFEPTDSFRKTYFYSKEDRKPRLLVGVSHQEEIVAAATAEISDWDRPTPAALKGTRLFEILLIGTNVAFQGRGFARNLLNVCADYAKADNCTHVYAFWPRDEQARAFWKAVDFSPVPFPSWGGDFWKDLRLNEDDGKFLEKMSLPRHFQSNVQLPIVKLIE